MEIILPEIHMYTINATSIEIYYSPIDCYGEYRIIHFKDLKRIDIGFETARNKLQFSFLDVVDNDATNTTEYTRDSFKMLAELMNAYETWKKYQ